MHDADTPAGSPRTDPAEDPAGRPAETTSPGTGPDSAPGSLPDPGRAQAEAGGGPAGGTAPNGTAEPADPAEPEPRDTGRPGRAAAWAALLNRGLRDPVVLVGAALILGSVALKIHVLGAAYFIEDDFLFIGNAAATDLTVDYLTDLHKGHLMPGAMLLAYIQAAIAPYSWAGASGVMLACQAGAAVAVFRLLWVVFGRRWAIVAPLALYCFAPLTVPVLAWWSAALNAVPFQLAIALALLWLVRYLRTGEVRYGWLTAGAVLLGMAFSVKAVFLPPLLFAFAAAFLVPGRLPRVLWRTADRDLPFWVGMALLSAGYGLVYLSRQDTAEGEGAGVPRAEAVADMARGLLGETFPVGAVGGPGQWGPVTPAGGLLDPPAWAVAAAWAVLLLVAAAGLLTRRRAWRAWALLAGYLVVVDLIPTAIARGRYESLVGYDPRYVADAALVFVLCLAFAFLPTRDEAEPVRRWVPPRRAARAVAVAVTAAMTAAGAYSTHAFTDTLSGDRVRWYLDTVRQSVRDVPAQAGIYPRPVPEDIVLPWNGPRRLTSHLLSPLAEPGVAERIREPEAANAALVFNDAGYLVPGEPVEGSAFFGPPEDEECVLTFGGQVMWPVESLGGPTLVLSIAYTSERATEVGAVLGDRWETTRLPAAPDGGVWYLPLDGAGDQLVLHTDEEELCMRWVTFGELQPVTEGDPWSEDAQEEARQDERDGEGDGGGRGDGSGEGRGGDGGEGGR
ncbi:hypothetical protein HNR12_002304 [Streptomonospora nanhaiensis]|uniref:Glycosyltransferase RgtA/B/C/D-like domain-containing protein n=1 Tax=Streptomonospora nanhaiensis TaxID=1323731 RepID=A0A853BMZ0_9ACTN|nr:hypothetical protein [Streptomonospora nanhaiensis]NYI96027.1 hypothetical protein [Streptomonospora nanhaiensis]